MTRALERLPTLAGASRNDIKTSCGSSIGALAAGALQDQAAQEPERRALRVSFETGPEGQPERGQELWA